MEFKDRVGKYPNRRKITILEQRGNEIIADIELKDEPESGNEGTALNAATLNAFQSNINNAVSTANNAKTTADNAKTTAESAVLTANDAEAIANQALNHAANIKGTTITVSGIEQNTFDADTKVDVNVFNNQNSTTSNRIDVLEDKLTKATYDSTTDTFSLDSKIETTQDLIISGNIYLS